MHPANRQIMIIRTRRYKTFLRKTGIVGAIPVAVGVAAAVIVEVADMDAVGLSVAVNVGGKVYVGYGVAVCCNV